MTEFLCPFTLIGTLIGMQPRYLQSSIPEHGVRNEPGGVIIGFDPQGVKFAYAGGLESLATGVPFTANTVVRYASITKHIFCAMVLRHADVISLNDRLGDHLPELQSPLADVSVGRALDMTSGLPDVRECLTLLGLSVYTHTDAESLLEFLSTMNRLNFGAGSEVSYSNTGYRLVEAALERRGLFFKDFVKSEISGLLETSIEVPDAWADPVKGLAPGYWKSEKNGRKVPPGFNSLLQAVWLAVAWPLQNGHRRCLRTRGHLADCFRCFQQSAFSMMVGQRAMVLVCAGMKLAASLSWDMADRIRVTKAISCSIPLRKPA